MSASITDGFNRTQTFQDATGTIALTSDIPSGASLWKDSSAYLTPNTTTRNISTTGSLTVGGNTYLATSSGNVGINTASPSAKLDVIGYIRANGGSAPVAGVGTEMVYDGANGSVLAYDRTSSVWKPMQVQGLTIALTSSGTNGLVMSATQVITLSSLGTGAVQATAGVLSVVSDSKVKNKYGRFGGSALSSLMRIPKPEYWSYNEKSGLPKVAQSVRQFGLYADSVYAILGGEFAPTQKQSKLDSANNIVTHSLSDRALLSLTIQALQEEKKEKDAEIKLLSDRVDAQQKDIDMLKKSLKISSSNRPIGQIGLSGRLDKMSANPDFKWK